LIPDSDSRPSVDDLLNHRVFEEKQDDKTTVRLNLAHDLHNDNKNKKNNSIYEENYNLNSVIQVWRECNYD